MSMWDVDNWDGYDAQVIEHFKSGMADETDWVTLETQYPEMHERVKEQMGEHYSKGEINPFAFYQMINGIIKSGKNPFSLIPNWSADYHRLINRAMLSSRKIGKKTLYDTYYNAMEKGNAINNLKPIIDTCQGKGMELESADKVKPVPDTDEGRFDAKKAELKTLADKFKVMAYGMELTGCAHDGVRIRDWAFEMVQAAHQVDMIKQRHSLRDRPKPERTRVSNDQQFRDMGLTDMDITFINQTLEDIKYGSKASRTLTVYPNGKKSTMSLAVNKGEVFGRITLDENGTLLNEFKVGIMPEIEPNISGLIMSQVDCLKKELANHNIGKKHTGDILESVSDIVHNGKTFERLFIHTLNNIPRVVEVNRIEQHIYVTLLAQGESLMIYRMEMK